MNKKLEREPLAIIGMACRFPMADDPDQFWTNILTGRDCITEIPAHSHWDPADYYDPDPKKPDHTYARRGGFIEPQPFEPLKYGIPPKSLEATDTTQLIGLIVAREAMEDAGYGLDKDYDRERVSCILGVTGTLELVIPLGARLGHPVWRKALRDAGLDEARTEAIVARIADGFVPWQEQSFPGLLGNVVAGRIANYLDLGGTNCVSDAACASALSALNLAAMELWSGKADMVLTGGVDTFNDIFMYMCFSKTPALSPTGNARPFSAEGDGTILGEGAGLVVLKRLSDARRDGDRVYATLLAVGSSSDGKGNAIYAPSSRGQVRALRRAYTAAGVSPREIGLIEGHGTGTRVGDAVELVALAEVFGQAETNGPWCAVGSVKSQIGHTKAAAGAAGLIKAVLSLCHGVLPPSIKVELPLEQLRQDQAALFLNNEARPWIPGKTPRRAGVSAFGFGGSNFHCVVEEAPLQRRIFWDGQVQILAFTATSRLELRRQVERLDASLSWNALKDLAAEQLRAFSSEASFRLLILLESDKADLVRTQAKALTLLEKFNDKSSWSAPEGIFFGSGAPQGKLGILFPGQGSQYCQMLRDLACRFPVMQQVLADVDKAFSDCEDFGDQGPLTRLIYPPPGWDSAIDARHEEVLRRTENAQPAIGAISIGLLKLLHGFGVSPDAAAGHSYGEIPALCASERFDVDALYLLSRLRGKLMATGDGDRGAMLAVRAPLQKVEAFIAEQRLDLVLANKNAPDQVVLSGPTAEIERAARLLGTAGMRNKRLPVAAAFHSTLVAQASQPFFAELQKVDFMTSTKPVYSNTTGQPYPEQPEEARNLLANQLSKPVEFVEEIRNMHRDGVRTFLEVGPGARLTALVKSILDGEAHEAMAVDASSGKRLGTFDLARVLAHLAALGHEVRLELWENAETRLPVAPKTKSGLIVPITGANHVSAETRAAAQRPIEPILAQKEILPATSQPHAVHEVPPLNASSSAPKSQVEPLTSTPVLPTQVTELIEASQRNIAMLQKLQEDTARLHGQFLQGQETAHHTLLALVQQQQALVSSSPLRSAAAGPVAPVRAALQTQPVVAATPVPRPVLARHEMPVVAAAPAKPAPVSAPVAQVARPVPAVDFAAILMRVISEKTGYPVDMLEPGMALDADLGIDSIKRVEIFSALHEAEPNLPILEPERIGRILTLAEIIALMPSATSVATSASPSHDRAKISAGLLKIVTEKTGYPAEMLDLSMSMDGDLGIDSIKRVEIFSALQESLPGLLAVEPDRMGSFVNLGDIVDYLAKRTAPVAGSVPAPVAVAAVGGAEICLREVVAEKTGYPEDMLELSMSLDGDLGIDSIKRVEILSALAEKWPQTPEIKPDQASNFRTLGDIVAHLNQLNPSVASASVAAFAESVPVGEIDAALLARIAEKTGYPADMLERTMSLDTDLGIDSIKRVEIFSALQETWSALPQISPEQISSFTTIGDVSSFLHRHLAAPATVSVPAPTQGARREQLVQALLRTVADKTGYPADMLELSMNLETDLGIDSIKRVEILSGLAEAMPGLREPKPDELSGLHRLEEIVEWFSPTGSDVMSQPVRVVAPVLAVPAQTPAPKLVRSLPTLVPLNEGGAPLELRPQAEVWLVSEEDELSKSLKEALQVRGLKVSQASAADFRRQSDSKPEGIILVAPDTCDENYLRDALMLVSAQLPQLRKAAKQSASFFATLTRLDGNLGFTGTCSATSQGALIGLAKTVALECPEIVCRAVDLERGDVAATLAERAVALCLSRGVVEVGLNAAGEVTVALVEADVEGANQKPWSKGDVVLVSGGARGVTAACTLELARRYQPRLILLGSGAAPSASEPEWAQGLSSEAELKKAILAHSERKLSPKELQAAYRGFREDREKREMLAAMRAAGAEVHYEQLDLRDGEAVRIQVAALRERFGAIRGLVHGAGVLADRRIEDKTEEQFDAVYGTKARGLQHLLEATAEDHLTGIALFSSSTGRFGRIGQVDYAMANEVLNKTADHLRFSRPECRVVSVNWGPWDGGMVTPELKSLFASEGIGVIDIEAGSRYLADELATQLSGPVEIVILGEVPKSATATVPLPQAMRQEMEEVFKFELSLESHGFLRSHVIGGKAVLPAVMMIEWCSHAAMVPNMGYQLAGIQSFKVLKGITLGANERLELHFEAGAAQAAGEQLIVPVNLFTKQGERKQPRCQMDVLLTEQLSPAQGQLQPVTGAWLGDEAVYDVLFHGPHFQGIESVDGFGASAMAVTAAAAPLADRWMNEPLRRSWLTDPLVIDCAFQMMVLWSVRQLGVPNLPVAIEALHIHGRFPRRPNHLRLLGEVRESSAHKAVCDIEILDAEGQLIARIQGYECVLDASLIEAYRAKFLFQEVAN